MTEREIEEIIDSGIYVLRREARPDKIRLSKITFTLHPDIVKVIKSTAEEERLPMSIVADEALYAGLKALGRMD